MSSWKLYVCWRKYWLHMTHLLELDRPYHHKLKNIEDNQRFFMVKDEEFYKQIIKG